MPKLIDRVQEYSINGINEIHEKTGYHWETIQDYIISLSFIQIFGQKIQYNPLTRRIKIARDPEYMEFLPKNDALLIFLFRNRIFNEDSAIGHILVQNKFGSQAISSLERTGSITTTTGKSKDLLYLSRKGKFKAQATLASINKEMGDFIDAGGKTAFNHWDTRERTACGFPRVEQDPRETGGWERAQFQPDAWRPSSNPHELSSLIPRDPIFSSSR